jgi:tetratricopeptide (TPR) repeat protein
MRCLQASVCLFVCVSILSIAPAVAQEAEMHAHHHDAPEQLGKVSFPISCAPASQKSFERGVALLHSFGYEDAEVQFVALTKSDPACAMAHWGVAMSQFHQIWERPEAPALKRGQEEIAIAQKIGGKTPREQAYISALAIFYQDPGKNDYLKRAGAYSEAMGKLYQQYPSDVEAGAFYALSILAAGQPDDTTHTAQKKAVAVLMPLFEQDPEHPGLAHYIIHSCDSPEMAPEGLAAARRYAEIASSSAHAVHMPSHIFARLGLWQEDIQASLKSVALASQSSDMFMHGHELHAMDFLLYAYLQTGQDQAAWQIVEQAKVIVAAAPKSGNDSGMMHYFALAQAHFPALYDLEMHKWPDAVALQPAPDAPMYLQTITYWAQTIGAARMGDVEAARRSAQKFDAAEEAVKKSKYAYMMEGPDPDRGEVHAWLAFAEKKNDEALQLMRETADIQDKVGKGEVAIPAREMLADMLLAANQPDKALVEYQKSMKIDPNRFNGLAGAAQAAELAHQPAQANAYYAQLLKNCDGGAHSARPELQAAKAQVTNNGQGF